MALRSLALSIVLFSTLARAEFRRVSIAYRGEECASCAGSMRKAFERLRGVTTVSLDSKKGVVTVELAPANRITLTEMRDSVKRVGFTPMEASVQVRGEISGDKSKKSLKLDPLPQSYELAGAPVPESGSVTLEGTIASPEPGVAETLLVVRLIQ